MNNTVIGRGQPRLTMVDSLRGYALMGLFLVHMTGYFELYNARPVPSWVQETTRVLFQGKSFSLLALCFGFSFFMMMDSARRKNQPFALRFAWRLIVLLGIGWLHALVYRGEIIVELAIVGFILIPFDRIRSSRALLAVAAVMLAQPYLIARIIAAYAGADWALRDPLFYHDGGAMRPSLFGTFPDVVQANIEAGKVAKWSYFIETGRIFQVMGLYLIGLVVGRSDFFADPERFRRIRNRVLAVALVVVTPLALIRLETCCHNRGPIYWVNTLFAGWTDLAGTAIILLAFVQLWQWGSGRVLGLFAPCGRMTLTLYIAQSLIFVPVFYGFGLHLWDRITQEQSLMLGVAAFVAQLVFATIWFRHFTYGPLEWIWRAATSLSLDVPFRRRQESLKPATT